ncbi:MAG TPA: hypothetical protein PKH77_26335 [Anaerolineae bacterium]|nr:hypothetical protein [Anaerolineae bacterium]
MFDIDTFRAWIKTHFVRKRDLNLLMGQWTPSIAFGGASTGIAYTLQHGLYTRVSNLCFIEVDLRLSAKGSSTGTATISGLPFPADANRNIGWVRWTNMATSFISLYALTGANSASLTLQGLTAAAVSYGGALYDTNFNNNTILLFNMVYRVSS